MKKYSFFMILVFAGATAFGQSMDEISKMINSGKNKQAKEAIDKFFSDPKNVAAKPEAYFYKGRAYNNYSKDSSLSPAESLKLKNEAFESLKKYQQLESKEILFILENHSTYFDLYNGYFDIGAKQFNTKNFEASLEGFKGALMIEDFVRSKDYEYNKFKFPALDTSLILNAAIAASQAKDTAASITYYRKLADANVGSESYLSIYQYLVEYYLKKKDDANLTSMLEKGRSLYPNEDYWTEVELDQVSKSGNKDALVAKYEELMKRYPTKYNYAYNLSVELYNQLYTGDNRPANADALKAKLTASLKAAIPNDKGIDATMLMIRHLYNDAFDYQDASKLIKGVKPEDVKKKAELKTLFISKIDECIPYAESAITFYTALPTLRPIQKANYKDVLDMMSQFYGAKGDLKKAAEYTKKKTDLP